MIHCVNPNISVQEAEIGIKKIFSIWFGAANILKIQLFKPTSNIYKLAAERIALKKQLKKLERKRARKKD